MNFASEASKLFCNKYFLYFIVFLSATNVLGYIVTNKVNAAIFFALVAFLMTNFSKNMAIVLLVAIIATNLLMANKSTREGLENATTDVAATDTTATDTTATTPTIDTEKLKAIKAKIEEKKSSSTEDTSSSTDETIPEDTNNRKPTKTTETFSSKGSKVTGHTTKGKKAGFHNAKNGSSFSNAAPVNGNSRIDYASTLEGAYDNLDKILGSDGINKLTGDTQKLMVQQQKLFTTMQGMLPMIEQAKGMMDGIDMSQFSGLADMANSLGR